MNKLEYINYLERMLARLEVRGDDASEVYAALIKACKELKEEVQKDVDI